MMIDLTAIYREDATEDETTAAYQHMIDNGSVWAMDGSTGRFAMDLLKGGYCTLPEVRHKDFWGNTIPSRHDVKPGSFGTPAFVKRMQRQRRKERHAN